jgi:hypothetical protein
MIDQASAARGAKTCSDRCHLAHRQARRQANTARRQDSPSSAVTAAMATIGRMVGDLDGEALTALSVTVSTTAWSLSVRLDSVMIDP